MKLATESKNADVALDCGSIVKRVKSRAETKRLAADAKTAAGFKAMAGKKATEGSTSLLNFFTPAKAASGTKVVKLKDSTSKIASIIKASPEKIAADRVAAFVNSRAVYDAECESCRCCMRCCSPEGSR